MKKINPEIKLEDLKETSNHSEKKEKNTRATKTTDVFGNGGNCSCNRCSG